MGTNENQEKEKEEKEATHKAFLSLSKSVKYNQDHLHKICKSLSYNDLLYIKDEFNNVETVNTVVDKLLNNPNPNTKLLNRKSKSINFNDMKDAFNNLPNNWISTEEIQQMEFLKQLKCVLNKV